MRVLKGIQDKDEWRFATLGGSGEHVGDAGEPAGFHDQGDALMAVESGERGERTAFDFDDRDPQVRGVQDELLQGGSALRDDEQSQRWPAGCEGLLYRAAPGHQLLAVTKCRRRWERGSTALSIPPGKRPTERAVGLVIAVWFGAPTLPESARLLSTVPLVTRGVPIAGMERRLGARARIPSPILGMLGLLRSASVGRRPRSCWPRRPISGVWSRSRAERAATAFGS